MGHEASVNDGVRNIGVYDSYGEDKIVVSVMRVY